MISMNSVFFDYDYSKDFSSIWLVMSQKPSEDIFE